MYVYYNVLVYFSIFDNELVKVNTFKFSPPPIAIIDEEMFHLFVSIQYSLCSSIMVKRMSSTTGFDCHALKSYILYLPIGNQ